MLSRGLFLISLTLFSQPQATVPIVQKFIHFPSQLANSGIHETIVGAHFAILGLYALTYTVLCPLLESRTVSHFPVRKESPGDISLWAKEFAKALLFYTLFSSMNSLVAFALYLGPWHSVGHMLSEISFLKSKQSPFFSKGSVVTWTDTATFLWYCAPFTLIAVVSMASAFWITTTSQVNVSYDDVNAWALFIISISIFTGPHLWIVAGLHSIKVSMDPLDLKTTVLSLYSMPSPSIDKKVTGKTA